MYTYFGEPMLTQVIANELTSPRHKTDELSLLVEVFKSIRMRANRLISQLQDRREVQQLAACQEMPQYC